MSEKRQITERYVPVWGIFLLFLGIVFLLQSLNVLPWALWGTLWHFWPVLIIIIGIGILLARFNVWLVSLLILALLSASLGIGIWQYQSQSLAGQSTKSYSEPLGDLQQARIEVDFSVGSLTISSLPVGSSNLVEAASTVKTGNADIKVNFSRQGNEGRLYLSKVQVKQPFPDEGDNRWQVRLTRDIPLTLNIKSAASNVELDLSQLEVTEFRLDIDVSNCRLTMPSSTDTVHAYINADVTNVEITIPNGVAARIQSDTGLSALDINQSIFPKQGDYYISDGFATAPKQIYLEISSDVGRVQVKRGIPSTLTY